MDIEDKKELLKQALITSFVDDYKIYKNSIDIINSDLLEYNINFQYTYDDFCREFLKKTLENIEVIDIFDNETYNDFYSKFLNLNLYNIHSMLVEKLKYLNQDDICF
jgi:hypothetical protein